MKILLERLVSPLCIERYEFDVKHDFIEYVGNSESRRNSKDDPWGHEWKDFYKIELDIINDKYNKLMEECEDEESADMLRIDWSIETDVYNPIVQRTKNGESFYGAEYGSRERLKKLPWTKDEVKELVLNAVLQKMKKTKWKILVD